MHSQPRNVVLTGLNPPNRSIISIVASVGLFWLISTPSIKIFYSHPLVNFLPVFILFYVMIAKARGGQVFVLKAAKPFVVGLFCFMLFFFAYYLIMPGSHRDIESFFRYFFFFLSLVLVIATSKQIDFGMLVTMIIVWGAVIALLKITDQLHLDAEKGQTYLTAGLPMGAALTASLLNVARRKGAGTLRMVLNIVALLVIITGLLLSPGRSNLVYPFLVATLYLFGLILTNRKARMKSLLLFLFLGSLVVYSYFTLSISNEFLVFSRITSAVESVDDESRYAIWSKTLGLIVSNPLGYGVDSYMYLLGYYPHNIFLEIGLSLGIVGLIFLLVLTLRYVSLLIFSLSKENRLGNILTGGLVGLYFFLAWNSSFDFATSYVPLSILLFFCVKASLVKQILDKESKSESFRNHSNV